MHTKYQHTKQSKQARNTRLLRQNLFKILKARKNQKQFNERRRRNVYLNRIRLLGFCNKQQKRRAHKQKKKKNYRAKRTKKNVCDCYSGSSERFIVRLWCVDEKIGWIFSFNHFSWWLCGLWQKTYLGVGVWVNREKEKCVAKCLISIFLCLLYASMLLRTG